MQAFNDVQEKNEQVKLDRVKELDVIKDSLQVAVEQIKDDAQLGMESVKAHNKKLRKAQNVAMANMHEFSNRLQRMRTAADDAVKATARIAQERNCLRSLLFTEIERRYGNVEKAHTATFDWIFRDNVPSGNDQNTRVEFGQWLREREGHFWVEGKAGSGKSTLMKYIYEHKKTKRFLQQWADAGNKRLVTAKHFFWHSGTSLQKSQEGLLRSLLVEILRRCPDLIHQIGHQNFSDTQSADGWSRQHLFAIFKKLSSCDLPVRFCFFVDGLDEYDGHDEELIELLQSLLRIPDLKICLSSRPFPQFRDAFGRNSNATLRLQDLTRNDIHTYVTSKFSNNEHFQHIAKKDARYPELVDSVVDRADGVFLWVHLVVSSLLEGVGNRDHLSDLQQRLEALPETLEKFFQHMIDGIEELYKKRAVETFLIALTCPEPSLLSTHSVLDHIRESNNQSSGSTSKTVTPQELVDMAEDTERRLYAWCQGLLHVSKGQDSREIIFGRDRVDFLHRSVRDFLSTKDMQNMLRAHSDNSFNANLELCRAIIGTIQILSTEQSVWSDRPTLADTDWADVELIQPLFFFARQIELHHQPGTKVVAASHSLHRQAEAALRDTEWKWRYKQLTFTGHAVEHHLAEYVKFRLNANPEMATMQMERPLLDYALVPRPLRFYGRLSPSLAMVSLILDKKANPNAHYKDWTVWARFLQTSRADASLRSKKFFAQPEMYDIVLKLIQHGADWNAVVKRTKVRRKLTGRAADLHKPNRTIIRTNAQACEWLKDDFPEQKFDRLSRYQQAERVTKPQCATM